MNIFIDVMVTKSHSGKFTKREKEKRNTPKSYTGIG
jgi:hypothetical protein